MVFLILRMDMWLSGKVFACQCLPMQEMWVWSLNWKESLEKEMATTPLFLPGKSHGWRSLVGAVCGITKSQTWLSDFTFTFHFHALEKEMATHSSVLTWRTPGTGEPGGLLSMGSHRVGHDWGDLAAAATIALLNMPLSNLRTYIFVAVFFQLTMRNIVQILQLMSFEGLDWN